MFHSQLVAVLSILSAKAQAAESETAQLKSRMVEEEATSYAIIEGKVLALVKVDIGFFSSLFSLTSLLSSLGGKLCRFSYHLLSLRGGGKQTDA